MTRSDTSTLDIITRRARRYRELVREWLPLDLGCMNTLTVILMIFFLYGFQRRYGIRPFDLSITSALYICYSLFTATVAVQLVNLAASRVRAVRLVINMLFLTLFTMIHTYYLITHIPLNCSIIIDNFTLGFYKESWYTIIGIFPNWFFIIIGISLVLLLMLHWRKKILVSPPEYPHAAKKTVVAALLYAVILLLPVKTHDEFTGLLRGILRYPFQDPMAGISVSGYPYLTTFNASPALPRGSSRPDIILVMVESYNANVVRKKSPEGKEITPVFNSLIPRGLYVERFYGNSVQTCKGQAAVLLSVLPSIRGKIFTSFPELSFRALPELLHDAGYDTLFMQAARELDFDNTRAFMKKAGFRHIHSAYEFLTDADAPQVWGWGPEDGLFYKLCLRQMERIRQRNGDRPVFALLATTSNHMWFDYVPKDKCLIYSDPTTIDQRYANSIHLSDQGLQDLLKGIAIRPHHANTAVIITGDHSFPINEHGISHNEVGFYDEVFRTPLLILWNSRIAPRILNEAYSQLDIAPTILDIAGISGVKTHFLGQSLVSPGVKTGPVYLIQPYNGLFLGIVEYPLKYIHHSETGKEYLFNLTTDPREEHNLARRGKPAVMKRLRKRLMDIYINQKILNSNRLWSTAESPRRKGLGSE